MPLNRAARQAQQMRGSRLRKPASGTWTPRIDVFGTLRLPGENESRVRLIEYAPSAFAAFTTDIANPATFHIDGDFNIKGRIMTAQIEDQGGEVKFQKAGCGCETPHELRTARSKLLAYVSATESETTQTPDELLRALQQIPGASV